MLSAVLLVVFLGFTGSVPPSNMARKARMRNGAVFPTKSYITLPKGGPTVKDVIHD